MRKIKIIILIISLVFSLTSISYAPLIVDHSKHKPEECVPPKIKIVSPKNKEKVKETIQIKVIVEEPVKPLEDYEVEYYIDYKLVCKSWVTKEPFSWDTTKYENGLHTIVVNCCDREDHRGAYLIRVIVDNLGDEKEKPCPNCP